MQLSCIRFDVVTTSGPRYLCVRVWVPGSEVAANWGRLLWRLWYTWNDVKV